MLPCYSYLRHVLKENTKAALREHDMERANHNGGKQAEEGTSTVDILD